MKTPVKILAMGNRYMGDDGIGPAVLETLATDPDFQSVPQIHCQGDMFALIDHFRNTHTVYLVDAVPTGQVPGSVTLFDPEEADYPMHVQRLSLHGFDLSLILDVARTLEIHPQVLRVVGVAPAVIRPEMDLSPAVRAAIPQVVDLLRAVVCTQTILA
ncbi:MAG: hydrogenase maturation protease [FCB group bacterium]|nr:hydrogenase maturation protease [FCB group bacterium]